MLSTIELTHAAWADALCLVRDAIDHELSVDSDTSALFVADPMLSIPTPGKDSNGRISIDIVIGNDGGALTDRFAVLKGSSERPAAKLRWFDDDGSLLLGPVLLELHEPSASGATITASLRTRNDEDLPAQPRAFTIENTPTLRGLGA